jgi:hypothetical protein
VGHGRRHGGNVKVKYTAQDVTSVTVDASETG